MGHDGTRADAHIGRLVLLLRGQRHKVAGVEACDAATVPSNAGTTCAKALAFQACACSIAFLDQACMMHSMCKRFPPHVLSCRRLGMA